MVGVQCLVTGRIDVPGTVALSGLGAATVNADLSWSYMFAPSSPGALSTTITATATSGGATSSVPIVLNVVAAAVFPGTVTPLFRMQHYAPAFQDLAGSTPATAPNAPVQRINNVSPLTGFWQSPAACARRDSTGVCVEPTDIPANVYPLQFLAGPGTSINLNDSTFVCSWVQRWGDFTLLIATGANPQWGISIPPSLAAFINGALATLGLTSVVGAHHTLIVRWTPTAVRAKLLVNGVSAGDITTSATITTGNPGGGELRVGHFQSYAYGTLVEMIGVNRAVSNTEFDQLLAYADSIPVRPAFPIDQPAIAWTGDSNVVGVGTSQYNTSKFYVNRALRSTYNPEMICTAIVGTSVIGHAGYIAPYYDARRRKHIAIFEAGTNDLANGFAASAVLPAAFNEMDMMRAQGWQVVARTLPDRNGLFGAGVTHSIWRTQADIYNAGIVSGVASRRIADPNGWTVSNIAAIPQVGADGAAPPNPPGVGNTYFSGDGVHLIDAGHVITHAPDLAAILSLLATPTISPPRRAVGGPGGALRTTSGSLVIY